MYQLAKVKKAVENQIMEIYAVEKDGRILCDFTVERKEAEQIINLLNDNDVEENHIIDIIEDFIYT